MYEIKNKYGKLVAKCFDKKIAEAIEEIVRLADEEEEQHIIASETDETLAIVYDPILSPTIRAKLTEVTGKEMGVRVG